MEVSEAVGSETMILLDFTASVVEGAADIDAMYARSL